MDPRLSPSLAAAVATESEIFARTYQWLEAHMPPALAEELSPDARSVLARHLMSFQVQGKFCHIRLKNLDLVLCLDSPDSDLRILKLFAHQAIRYYRTFVSNAPPPGEGQGALKIALIAVRDVPKDEHDALDPKRKDELLQLLKTKHPNGDIETLLHGLTPRFVRSLKNGRLAVAIDLFFKAKASDECQVEVIRGEKLQLVLAWKNVPKAGFLYRLATMLHTHGLVLRKVSAAYIDPYSTQSVLLLSVALDGTADMTDLLRELCLLKYFDTNDAIEATFVRTKLLTGNEAHLVRNFAAFAHQMLLLADPNLYSFEQVVEGLCRHPELTQQLCKLFEAKFRHGKHDPKPFLEQLSKLDTGQPLNDARRKNILTQSLQLVEYTLKTNFYRANKTGFSFRLDPRCVDKDKFPELPFGIFFLRGMHWIGFHVRFKDLARGGVRTVMPDRWETYVLERNNIFTEAYNLAYTQQKKNKDIPEGGAKTAILLKPYAEVFALEEEIFCNELDGMDAQVLEQRKKTYQREHKLEYLYASQRAFVESFMTLVNCDEHGKLLADGVIDYYKKPEYIYLGPDENMLNDMIVWICAYAEKCGYKPGRSFMSSKPGAGINHKEYGVTSLGVNVYLHQALLFTGIDPEKQPFTVKISGGPDGDVAGNEIHILATKYAKTAKLLALTDVSGTIFDPQGLDWGVMDQLFREGKSIRHYPAEKLHDGGYLLDLATKQELSPLVQQTLLLRKKGTSVEKQWLSGNEMNVLYRNNVHQTKTDAFVPGGGRPRTLNDSNYVSFLDGEGKPTSKIIAEGANLYLTAGARRALEKLGTIVLKDSSCNKGGVICSSFEVLAGLCLTEQEFLKEKPEYVKQVLELIRHAAMHEANLLLETHRKTGAFLTDLSEQVSERINLYKYQLLETLEKTKLSSDPKDPLIRCLMLYCPALLRERYSDRILKLPDIHKKAMIAVFLASHLVYTRGLEWSPGVSDVLGAILQDPKILGD